MDVDDTLPVGERLVDRRDHMFEDAGIVDEDIDLAGEGDRMIEDRVNITFVADVAAHDRAAPLEERRRGFARTLDIAVHQNDLRAELVKLDRRCESDAARRAGDDRGAPPERTFEAHAPAFSRKARTSAICSSLTLESAS